MSDRLAAAREAGRRAGDASMRAGGREVWNAEDRAAASRAYEQTIGAEGAATREGAGKAAGEGEPGTPAAIIATPDRLQQHGEGSGGTRTAKTEADAETGVAGPGVTASPDPDPRPVLCATCSPNGRDCGLVPVMARDGSLERWDDCPDCPKPLTLEDRDIFVSDVLRLHGTSGESCVLRYERTLRDVEHVASEAMTAAAQNAAERDEAKRLLAEAQAEVGRLRAWRTRWKGAAKEFWRSFNYIFVSYQGLGAEFVDETDALRARVEKLEGLLQQTLCLVGPTCPAPATRLYDEIRAALNREDSDER